ncbi:secreted protein [Luminiphilus syltensis NOR5-1B]|uniref:Secreted protein n=1 Tax=Luminiphilus syltensis NOR5-1B TaxID=565045 RepID=B8KUL7_9GAMM|nr:class I SAM-dependent methyltransferase [Luminiphilus syltensis]EED34807.1 secreted protein [Luminiphilus syltensis NOR5-1B]
MATPPNDLVRGFMDNVEGAALHDAALEATRIGPALEIGSYCGRSTLWLAQAAQRNNTVVFAVDHHRGSEEHQPGEFFHDPALTDADGDLDSFPEFRRNLKKSGLEAFVIPVVADSAVLGRHWHSPLGMVFIDGGHSLDSALSDYRTWAPRIVQGGCLAIHDVFPDPALGGQAPFAIWQLAQQSGLFQSNGQTGSLRLLRKL